MLRQVLTEVVERALRPVVEELRAEIRANADRAKALPGPSTMLSTAEAADLMGVQQATVRRWIDDGRLPAYGTARALRVRHDDLLAIRPGKVSLLDVQSRASNIVELHGRK